MKRKNLIIAIVAVSAAIFVYLNPFFLQAKNEDLKISDDILIYTTESDKICCEKIRNIFENNLKSRNGVRDVEIENKPDAAGTVSITVKYSKAETTEKEVSDYIISAEFEALNSAGCSSDVKKSCSQSDKKSDCGKKCKSENKGCNK